MKTKVIPEPPAAGRLIALSFFAVLATVLGVQFLNIVVFFEGVETGDALVGVWLFGLLILAPTFLFVGLSFSEQRVSIALKEAMALWAGTFFALCIWFQIIPPSTSLINLPAGLLLGIFYGAARLAARWIVRKHFVRVVIQTGTLCESCGHDLSGAGGESCPSCGEAFFGSTVDRTTAETASR
jgi:predicted RNA-binding Zn-ribbon protein involved in translation (DUF1610 family)